MQPDQENHFQNYQTLISKWIKTYKYAFISSFFCKTLSKGTVLLRGRTILLPRNNGINYETINFETNSLLAVSSLIPITEAEIFAIINNTKQYQLLINGQLYPLYCNSHGSVFSYLTYNPDINEVTCIPTLTVSGSAFNELIPIGPEYSRLLDWEIKSNDEPFDNLHGLLSSLGFGDFTLNTSSRLELISSPPGKFMAGSEIKNNHFYIKCELGLDLNHDKIKVGYNFFNDNKFIRGKIDGRDMNWEVNDEMQIGQIAHKVEGVSVGKIYLSYDNILLNHWILQDPEKHLNYATILHKTYDNNFSVLKQVLLDPRKSQQDIFEGCVTILFYLLGFTVVNYGVIAKFQDGPDTLAISPNGNIAVIESTIGTLKENDKMAKLSRRSSNIKLEFDQAGQKYRSVQPVLVTALSKAQIISELDAARTNQIAVICKENLEPLIQGFLNTQNAEANFEALKSFIPPKNPPIPMAG